MPSDKEIIEGIAANKSSIVQYIYDEYYPPIEAYISSHGGNRDQSQDIFQEGMIIIFKKIKANKLILTCKFSTYLYSICKRKWIQEKNKKIQQINKLKEMSLAAEPIVTYGDDIISQAKEILDHHFLKLSSDCQQILRLHFNGVNINEIQKNMGISSIHNTSDKKFRCKKKLISRIINDPLFKKLQK